MTRRRSRRRNTSLGATAVLFVLAGLVYLLNQVAGPSPTPTLPAAVTGQAHDWYQLYFSTPKNPDTAADHHGGPDEAVVASINAARQSIDLAMYELSLENVAQALAAAHRRGVRVRVVTDSDNIEEDAIGTLEKTGIEVLGDRREAIMHDKFVVIDGASVWTGSMNFTGNGAYRNNNNFILLQSTRLAADYTAEFEEMFVDDQFGPTSPAGTPFPQVTVNGTLIEVLFSPEDHPAQRILELIRGAQSSIYFMAFSFTSDEIADAILERAAAGVRVQGVFDESQDSASKSSSEYERMRNAPGVEVRLDGNQYRLHSKVILLDGQIVITGSYNFSAAAEKSNDENVIIFHNEDIAAQYGAEFVKLFEIGQ
ncbi:MAG: DUF1669 domain-containing protein [Chloroflexi bacterium]|nr:DUF1669 domain-containing protein [Chloroflexota bacterium]